MTSVVGYPRTVCIVSLIGLRRFLAAEEVCFVGVDLVVKAVQKYVMTFILTYILFVNMLLKPA